MLPDDAVIDALDDIIMKATQAGDYDRAKTFANFKLKLLNGDEDYLNNCFVD